MKPNAGCWMPPLAVLAVVASLLSGCATGRSEGVATGACPPVVEYSLEFRSRAVAELEQLPEGAAIDAMLSDYAVMRDQARACRLS